MGIRGFKKLCKRERINYEQVQKRGMQPSVLEKLFKNREHQKRSRIARLERINARKLAKDSPMSTRSEDF